VKFIIVDAVS